MSDFESLTLIAIILIAGAMTAALLFSPGARRRRRLRKTHSRIISKANRPTVKFSVKTPRDKR
jgi:hypothetical protein